MRPISNYAHSYEQMDGPNGLTFCMHAQMGLIRQRSDFTLIRNDESLDKRYHANLPTVQCTPNYHQLREKSAKNGISFPLLLIKQSLSVASHSWSNKARERTKLLREKSSREVQANKQTVERREIITVFLLRIYQKFILSKFAVGPKR